MSIDKIIVLENKEEYLILDKVNDDGTDYYYVAKINELETDIENNYKLITIKEEDNNQIISEVTGEEKLKKILPLFKNSI